MSGRPAGERKFFDGRRDAPPYNKTHESRVSEGHWYEASEGEWRKRSAPSIAGEVFFESHWTHWELYGWALLFQSSRDIAWGTGFSCEEAVAGRDEEEGEKRGNQYAAEYDGSDGGAGFGAGSEGENQRDRRGGGGEASHEDRAQAHARRFQQGVVESHAPIAKLVGEFDDKDAVFCGDADEDDEADLAVEVQRAAGEVDSEETTGDGEGNGEHDDERVDPAFKLGRKDEENDDEAKREDEEEGLAGFLEVAGLAFVVDLSGLGEVLAGEGAQVFERFAKSVAFGEVGFDRKGA